MGIVWAAEVYWMLGCLFLILFLQFGDVYAGCGIHLLGY